MRRLFRLLLVGGLLAGLWVLLRELLEGQSAPTREAPLRQEGGSTGASDGQGSANGVGELSKAELYEQAQRLDVPGRSKMSKEELAKAVAEARRAR